MTQEQFPLLKNSFLVSWIIFSIIFHVTLIFLIGVILIATSLTQDFFYFTATFFIFMMTILNLMVYFSYKNAKKGIIKDFIHPRDDTATIFSHFLNFFYLQPSLISHPFEFIYRVLQLSMTYGPFISALEIRGDWHAIWENQEKFCDENERHSAIIIGVYNQFAKTGMLGCGISILIQWLNANNVKYRVYFFKNTMEFFDVMNNPAVTNVWIFAHGWRGGIRTYGAKCPYNELIKKICHESLAKEGVYQFHCNPGNEPSLVELSKAKRGFVNHRINRLEGIKAIIQILIENNRMNELIILK